MKNIKTILFLLFSIFIFSKANAQEKVPIWKTSFNFGGESDIPYNLIIEPNGNLVVNGHKDNSEVKASIAKFSDTGSLLWKDVDSSAVWTSSAYGSSVSIQNSIIWSILDIMDPNQNSRLVKKDNQGKTVWEKSGFHGWLYLTNFQDSLFLVVENQNTILVFDSAGTLKKSVPLPVSDLKGVIDLKIIGNNVWIFSKQASLKGFVAKMNLETKETIWMTTFADSVVATHGVVDKFGNAYFIGDRITSNPSGPHAFMFVKFDDQGNITKQKEWFGRTNYEANWENSTYSADISPNANIIVMSGIIEKTLDQHTAGRTAYLAGIDLSGNILWEMKWEYDSEAIVNNAFSCKFDKDGNLVVLGDTFSGGSSNPSHPNICYLWKFSKDQITDVKEVASQTPTTYSLSQNYPNPFNPSTKIQFSITKASFVILRVYDVLGREVETLVSGEKGSGTYEVTFDASSLPSGVYVYRLQTGSFVETKKMILMK